MIQTFTVRQMPKLRKNEMGVCHGLSMLFIHCSIKEICYDRKHRFHLGKGFSFKHAFDCIIIIDLVQVSEMSPFRKSTFMVSFPQSLWDAVRRKLRAYGPGVETFCGLLQQGGTWCIWQVASFTSLTCQDWSSVIDQMRKKYHSSGNAASVRKPIRSRMEDYGDNNMLSRACSASIWTFQIVQLICCICPLTDCVLCEQSEDMNNFISGEVGGN